MKVKAIFFDLDGTLLPMDQDTFIGAYLKGLVNLMAPLGYDPKAVAAALWQSTAAMMKNDGSSSNEEIFWKSFCSILGDRVKDEEGRLEEFYKGDFQKISQVCGHEKRSLALVNMLREKGLSVILATSPLFPTIATESRIRWAGLEPEQFDYVTTYENSNYCKPNPMYYVDLLEKTGFEAEECIMVGNDVGDDMIAEKVGMKVFLLTDCLINKSEADITRYAHGDFDAMYKYMENL